MAQPTRRQVHVDAVLSNISVAYMQEATNFVATRVFPVIAVDKQSDLYNVYTKNDWFRDEMQQRPPATESAGSGYGISTASYEAKVWALHKDVDDQVLNNADASINLETEAVQFLSQRALLRQEIQWATDYFTTGIWGNDVTPGVLWSTYATSDPITDVELGKETILGRTGREPNTLVMGYSTFRILKWHPDIRDVIKYTSDQVTTEQIMARIFGLERVLVAKGVKATNIEGAAAAYAFTHGKHALLCHVAPNPGLLTPSAGYTFQWTGVSDGLGTTAGVRRFEMPELRADRFEIQIAFANKVVGSDLGYFFNGAVA